MLSFFSVPIINFNGTIAGGNPAVEIFGFPIAYYALIIVTGMALAIVIFAYLLKKQGLNPDDSLDYAICVLPLAVLGARVYFFLFPYSSSLSNWSEFWDFRDGGLGIYGGVIVGYLVVHCVARVKMESFTRVGDCIAPGLLLAQSIGRWGNFVNSEAYGEEITNPVWQWFPAAVEINGKFYQATFFYESFLTLLGFIITICLITKWKKYPRGFNVAFYGVYYGVVRLVIESLRSDSLYLWIRWGETAFNTGIKISQFVSCIAIAMGLVRYILIFTKWDKRFDGWCIGLFNVRQSMDKRVMAAADRAERLKCEADSILSQLNNPHDRLYLDAKRKADNALLAAVEIAGRRDGYMADLSNRGVVLVEKKNKGKKQVVSDNIDASSNDTK